MAIDMGSELDNQNRMIDRINVKVSSHKLCIELLMNLRCVSTFLGRIERNKDSSGKRASSSAPQVNLSFDNIHPHTHLPIQINQAKQINKIYQKRNNNNMPILLRKRKKNKQAKSLYLYKLCIKIDKMIEVKTNITQRNERKQGRTFKCTERKII